MATEKRKPATLKELNIGQDFVPFVKMKDLVGQVVILHAHRYKTTEHGEYPIFTCELPDRPRIFEMAAYGTAVMEQSKAFTDDVYPLLVKVAQIGETYFFE